MTQRQHQGDRKAMTPPERSVTEDTALTARSLDPAKSASGPRAALSHRGGIAIDPTRPRHLFDHLVGAQQDRWRHKSPSPLAVVALTAISILRLPNFADGRFNIERADVAH
jgi:hypothetical protein